jgi:hypothetical protein
MSRIQQFRLVALTLAVLTSTARAQERVRDWGDPARIAIEGCREFTAESILRALKSNVDVIDASHSQAPLDKYLAELTKRLSQGYSHAGFAQAKVSVERQDYRPPKLILSIEEGPRFRCGVVSVKNPGNVVPEQLAAWLTSKQPRANSVLTGFAQTADKHVANWADSNGTAVELQPPAWKAGEWAAFDEGSIERLKRQTARALADLGYPWADFEIALPTDEAQKTAQLDVTINELGAPAVVNHVKVEGNDRDSVEDILRYLQVPLGSTMSESARSQIWYKLWQSGRYLKHDVELIPPQQPGDEVELQITLKEYDKAPALAKQLSTEEEALLKCREWLVAAPHRGDDWVLRFSKPTNACVIASPIHGALIRVEPELKSKQPCKFAAAMSPGGFLYSSSALPHKIAVPLNDARFVGSVQFKALEGEDEKKFQLVMGLGLSSKDENEKKSPAELSVSISPVFVLGLAHEHNAKCAINGRLLTIETDDEGSKTLIQLETDTGKLVRLQIGDVGDEIITEITLERGAFQREWAAANKGLENRMSGPTNAFDLKRSLSSVIEQFCNDQSLGNILGESLEESIEPDQLNKLRRLALNSVRAGLLRPLDEKLAEWVASDQSPESFSIPDDFKEPLDAWNGFCLAAMRFALGSGDDIFPRDSSPWLMLRAATLLMLGHPEYSQADAASIAAAKDFGPLEHLLAATVLNSWSDKARENAVPWLVKHGLDRLENSHLQAELVPLLARDKFSGQTIKHLAEVLGELDAEDTAVLGELLLGERKDLFCTATDWLHQHKDRPAEMVLPIVLDQLWNAGLKSAVAEQLREIVGQAEAPPIPVADAPPEKETEAKVR